MIATAIVTSVAAVLNIATAPVARADGQATTGEYWIGVEGFRHVLSLYGGVTWAPFATMNESGLRLRAAGSISRYDGAHAYTTVVNVGNAVVEQTALDRTNSTKQSAHAMIGWQWTTGPLTTKAFAGLAFAGERHVSSVSGQTDRANAMGAAAALEMWYNLSSASWATLDLLYTGTHRDVSARLRWGFRLNDKVSVGPEVAWAGNQGGDLTRGGAFMRYDNGLSEFNISVNAARASNAAPSLYIATQWMQRF